MGRDTTEIERAVARSLRDSLERLQRSTDEVNQAIGDLVSACSSARPSNALPHMLRAQTSAASLAATLDVLARFITSAMQPSWNAPFSRPEASPEAERSNPVEARTEVTDSFAAPSYPPSSPTFEPSAELEPAPAAVEEALWTVASETAAIEQATVVEPPLPTQVPQPPLERSVFDLASLPIDQQELHRRANRVAKVSMQDIKMLRPGDVRAGKENNDLCLRLRDDIERAHKEYERRFHAILGHPVDYFYAWMVEILGEGDSRALGEYPYPSTVVHR